MRKERHADFIRREKIMHDAEWFFQHGYLDIIPSLLEEAFPSGLQEYAWYLTNWNTSYALYSIEFVEYVHTIWIKLEFALF